MNNKKAFSLIELLVVVAIIAILAGVAAPIYNQYQGKARIGGVILYLQSIGENALATYQRTGSFPSTILFGTNAGNWRLVNNGNIASGYYTVGVDGKGIIVGATILNLNGVPNYIAPSTTTAGSGSPGDGAIGANTLFIGIRDVNGSIKMNCGFWNVASYPQQSPPLGVLPSNCQCQAVQTFADSGALGTGCT